MNRLVTLASAEKICRKYVPTARSSKPICWFTPSSSTVLIILPFKSINWAWVSTGFGASVIWEAIANEGYGFGGVVKLPPAVGSLSQKNAFWRICEHI